MADRPALNRRQFLAGLTVIAAAGCAASPTAAPTTGPADGNDASEPATSGPAAPSPTGAPVTPASATPYLPPPPPAGAPALYVAHGPRTGNAVSLTYHASGDPTLAADMLDLLRDHAVWVTVFAVGSWLANNPALGQRIVAEGHELANHTKTHRSMGSLNATALRTEIVGGKDALQPFIGSKSAWFRPSGIAVPTALILAEAGRAGYPYSVGYDLDTLDFQDPGADAVVANFASGVQPGSIVSMHLGHQNTIDATPRILADLATRGLRHVTVTELLG